MCQAVMQWEIAAASAVVWHVDRGDARRRAHGWANETTTEPESDAACRCLGQEWGPPVPSEAGSLRIPFLEVPEGRYAVETGGPSTASLASKPPTLMEQRPPPHDCRDGLLGAVGNGDLKPPWRHRASQTAANSMCPEAQPIFRGGHDTVICDVACCPTWVSSPCVQSAQGGMIVEDMYVPSICGSR